MASKRSKIIIIAIIMVVIAGLFFGVIGRKENKMIIRVAGWDMEYAISDRKLIVEDFESIELGSSLDEIENKLGEPDGWIGGGMLFPIYVLEDNSAIKLIFNNDVTCEDLVAIYLYIGQEKTVIKKK